MIARGAIIAGTARRLAAELDVAQAEARGFGPLEFDRGMGDPLRDAVGDGVADGASFLNL